MARLVHSCRVTYGLNGRQRITRRTVDRQFQIKISAQSVEQCRRQQRVTVGPAEGIVRFVVVETVLQRVVGSIQHAQSGALPQTNLADCDTQCARIARQAEFGGRSGA